MPSPSRPAGLVGREVRVTTSSQLQRVLLRSAVSLANRQRHKRCSSEATRQPGEQKSLVDAPIKHWDRDHVNVELCGSSVPRSSHLRCT